MTLLRIQVIEDAYSLCKEASFVTEYLENGSNRNKFLPSLPRTQEEASSMDDFLTKMWGQLFSLNAQNQLPDSKLDAISKLIPKYFSQVEELKKADKQSAFSIIALAIIRWLGDIGRAVIGIILYPPKK